jgi:hypothetical protein
LRLGQTNSKLSCVTEPLIERSEIVALLFNLSDVAVNVGKIRELLEEDDDEEEADEG